MSPTRSHPAPAAGALVHAEPTARPNGAATTLSALLLAALLAAPAPAQDAPEPGEEEAAAAPAPAEAEEMKLFQRLLDARMKGNEYAAEMQKKIDEVADETDVLAAQHRTAVKQVAAIRQFNDRMRELVGSQEAELAGVAEQLNRVEEVDRAVTPLMLRMIDALESFVQLDVPFLIEERTERIAMLRQLMDRADVTNSTKYRQIMEAYQIENEYGRTIEAYRGTIQLEGGASTVDLLRFGRISLAFQSLDGSITGAWNQQTRSWDVLDASHAGAVRDGLRIARKLEPPDLIRVPLPPPQGTEAQVAKAAD